LLAGLASYAQAQVRLEPEPKSNQLIIYGSIDDGIDYVNNIHGSSQWAMNNGKRSPDRFGFIDSEDLGNGMKAIFHLETGFNSRVGTQANPTVLFNRYSSVGLSDATLGTVSLGRMPDFVYTNVGALNNAVPGISWAYSPGNLDGLASVYQFDNTLRYETADYKGFQAGLMNSFGGVAGNNGTSRQYGGGFKYDNGSFRIGGAYTMSHNRVADLRGTFGVTTELGQAIAPGAMFNATKYGVTAIGTSYKIGIYVPHATWTKVDLQNTAGEVTERNSEVGVNIDLSGGNKTDFFGISFSRSTFASFAYNQGNLFLSHYLSPHVQVYTGCALQRASGKGAVAEAFGYIASTTQSQALARVGMQYQF
jgi:predicted porin